MSSSANLVFDPDGDVLLVLNGPLKERDVAAFMFPDASGDAPSSQEPRTVEDVEVKVSSKHLALSSQVFRVMFDGRFQEGIVLEGRQLRRVPLPDDDADAMMILLNIIHGLTRRIPHYMDLSLLTDIAILVDKYALHEVTEVYTCIWFSKLYRPYSSPPSELTDWIFICWVFGRPNEFEKLTRAAILDCGLKFEDNGLPFPEWIASNIQRTRLSGIEKALANFDKLVIRYLGEDKQYYCDTTCDGAGLEDLVKELMAGGLYPLPEANAVEMSIATLCARLRATKVTSPCQLPFSTPPSPRLTHSSSSSRRTIPTWGTSYLLREAAMKFQREIRGLDLENPSENGRPFPGKSSWC